MSLYGITSHKIVRLVALSSRKNVIIFLDTDKYASPFDMLVAIDLYPDAQIINYSNVEVSDAKRLIQDAMFPRGPEGAKHTKVFIGGQDVDKALEILKVVKKSMFPPFELSVIVDPRGSNTTASAAVAKTMKLFKEKGFGDFKGKTAAILAGTGPVGVVAARLYASEGGNVVLTSRKLDRATAAANKINEELGTNQVRGAQAATPEEIGAAIKDADIVLACGAAGIQLLPLSVLEKYGQKVKVLGDINAVPPLGVEGVKATHKGKEFIPGKFGIGALAIGPLKIQVEGEMFKQAVENPSGIVD
ncbi:MAG: methylenetetrahydromethanopterin dehydrogenase [Candidatus Bathyarchaeum sp.]|nr:MAG: methylenetetrahydromethanopterin dehydrogenase [Candidatus Bathyarchaeum sp.]